MTFVYFPDDALSATELAAARLDGHLIELGAGYLAADSPDTPWMRARSLRPVLGDVLAATHRTAAWVHGALDEAPPRWEVQRCSPHRLHRIPDWRLDYRDLQILPADLVRMAGVHITTPARTVADLARPDTGDPETLAALLSLLPEAATAALDWFRDNPGRPGARAARETLQEWLRTR
ncbi:type IV toxin-antitoxin system AbiEi family antitoxin [Microbacterium gorillae]|uniref:type IV toxin-antitoxin system AbiEi family antitoxin n=1 Tax=Microbacterium gorillae TaxID=1231063 RepID=UPI00069393CA|nr:type IV toxin-antitoxin system AbiEi family antitoxin [Microbacterium gorillae]